MSKFEELVNAQLAAIERVRQRKLQGFAFFTEFIQSFAQFLGMPQDRLRFFSPKIIDPETGRAAGDDMFHYQDGWMQSYLYLPLGQMEVLVPFSSFLILLQEICRRRWSTINMFSR